MIAIASILQRLSAVLMAATLVLAAQSCGDDDDYSPQPNTGTPSDGKFRLEGIYSNDDPGKWEKPEFDIQYIDEEITYTDLEYANANPFLEMRIGSISISDQDVGYLIDDIIIEEQNDLGEWVINSEYEQEVNTVTDIGVVLVLDVSNSLEDNFENIKTYAKQFVDSFARYTNTFGQVALVAFADDTVMYDFTDRYARVKKHIDELQPGQLTKLYDAVDGAVKLIKDRDFDAKSVVTFTDGTNNNSVITEVSTVVDSITAAEGVRSYTIGLQGDMSIQAMQALAVRGFYRGADDILDIGEIFRDYSRRITDVYTITYRRSLIDQPRPIRFVIDANAK